MFLHLRHLDFRRDAVDASPAAAAVFLTDGAVPQAGRILRQPDLSRTLETIAQKGRAGFYQGAVAAALVQGVREAGGIFTDLNGEQPSLETRSVLAANAALHAHYLEALRG